MHTVVHIHIIAYGSFGVFVIITSNVEEKANCNSQLGFSRKPMVNLASLYMQSIRYKYKSLKLQVCQLNYNCKCQLHLQLKSSIPRREQSSWFHPVAKCIQYHALIPTWNPRILESWESRQLSRTMSPIVINHQSNPTWPGQTRFTFGGPDPPPMYVSYHLRRRKAIVLLHPCKFDFNGFLWHILRSASLPLAVRSHRLLFMPFAIPCARFEIFTANFPWIMYIFMNNRILFVITRVRSIG